MKIHWIPLALLLATAPLLIIEMRSEAQDHTSAEHKTHDLAKPAGRTAQTSIINFGGALGFTYSPQDSFILPGDTIRWIGDFAAHPLVSDDALWQQVSTGSEFSYTFNDPGRYGFHCFFHSSFGMVGTVTVATTYFLPLLIN